MIKHLASAILILAPLSFASADPYTNATTNANCTAAQANVSIPPQRTVYYLKNLLQTFDHSPIKGEFIGANNAFANAYANSTPTMNTAAASAGWIYTFTMKINACPGQSPSSKSYMADPPNSIAHNITYTTSTTTLKFNCTLDTELNLDTTATSTTSTWNGSQTGQATTQGGTNSSQSCSTTLSCYFSETVTNICQQSH